MNMYRTKRLGSAGLAASALALLLAACGGGGGGGGSDFAAPTVPPTIETGSTALLRATALTVRVDSARVSGRPVVEFTVTNQAGVGMTGLTEADLRFNISKLMATASGESRWQNYLNVANGGVVQAAQERAGTGGRAFGTLERLGSGRYRYTFATDITDPSANPCPAGCTDAAGQPLDLRFDAGLTHRVAIEQANVAYPRAAAVLDFVPAGGDVVAVRDIVGTATCNTCHAELVAHETRADVRLCVTCHNPGSTLAGSPNQSLDLKAMVHRIHYNNEGAVLPGIAAGGPSRIGSHDLTHVTFPQDARNCTRCHDTAVATQADRWKSQPSLGACASCHDNVYYGPVQGPRQAWQTQDHAGGPMADESTCVLCHGAQRFGDAKDIPVAHDKPARLAAAAARFQYNILGVTGATAGGTPVITFSVTDPTRNGAAYDLKADPAFTATTNGTSRLAISIGWTTTDFTNEGSAQAFGQPVSIDALSTAAVPGATAGTYTVTSPVALPTPFTGTLRVTIDGHPAGNVTSATAFADRLQVKNVFRDVGVGGAAVPRRTVVDVAKCNVCHATLSLHGNNRTDEIGVCVVCHNPNATDRQRRVQSGRSTFPDGKAEESIDFKRLIHGIHAGQASNGGFRQQGVTVFGFGGSVNDFTKVVFPGRLSDCATCHVGTTYQLAAETFATPKARGILGSTVASGADPVLPADNLRISPTAAVCSSCHDGAVAQAHMRDGASGGLFLVTQPALNAAPEENCTFCHGAGDALDVKTVHRVQ